MSSKIFIPFSEALFNADDFVPGELVPYQLAYRCVHLLDGSYDFQPLAGEKTDEETGTETGAVSGAVKVELSPARDLISHKHLISRKQMGHAA